MYSSFISNAWQSGEWRHRQKILGEKDLARKKKYDLYHILTDELGLFDKEYFVLYEWHHNALKICFHWNFIEEISVETN